MESVLVTFLVVILVLFAVSTLAEANFSAQTDLAEVIQDAQVRSDLLARTHLAVVDASTAENGAVVELALLNTGSTRLTNFDRWDVLIHYYDSADNYRIQWLPYNPTAPVPNQWGATGISVENGHSEDYDRGVLNPGEQLHLQLRLMNAVKPGTLVHVNVSTESGIRAEGQLISNVMPELSVNTGAVQLAGENLVIVVTPRSWTRKCLCLF